MGTLIDFEAFEYLYVAVCVVGYIPGKHHPINFSNDMAMRACIECGICYMHGSVLGKARRCGTTLLPGHATNRPRR